MMGLRDNSLERDIVADVFFGANRSYLRALIFALHPLIGSITSSSTSLCIFLADYSKETRAKGQAELGTRLTF
jgi:hypothetical protein